MTESTLLPPQCLEAEQATIGACLIDPGALLRAREIITAEDFYRAAHQRIFAEYRSGQQEEAQETICFTT